MERSNVYYTNFCIMRTRGKLVNYVQPMYYMEVFEGNTRETSQFFDDSKDAYEFGKRESFGLSDAHVYCTVYSIRRSSNGRFVLKPTSWRSRWFYK